MTTQTETHPVFVMVSTGVQEWRAAAPPLWKLCAEKGVAFKAAALPKWCERMKAKECYSNAAALAVLRKTVSTELYYCEGLAVSAVLPFPLEHAWVCTADGSVIDPTWEQPDQCSYFGFAFTAAYVKKTIFKHGCYGLGFGSYAVAREWAVAGESRLAIPEGALATCMHTAG